MGKIPENLHVVILCGGGGKRLWPVSTPQLPKQFISILADGRTLFQETLKRAQELVPPERIWVITLRRYYPYLQDYLSELREENIILEPQAKNTALAHLVSTIYILQKDPQAIVLNLASDHFIPQVDLFKKEIQGAVEFLLLHRYLLTVGIKPTHPDTNYGYIKEGQKLAEIDDFHFYQVAEFREKPDLRTAQRYFKEGGYYWNACLYLWRGSDFLATVERVNPQLWGLAERLRRVLGKSKRKERKVLESIYREAEDISVDYAVSERADNLAVFPASFFWSDVGNWQSIYSLWEKDEQENASLGERDRICLLESFGNLVRAEEKRVVVFGVSDMIIIEAADAFLVCPLSRAAEIGEVYQRVKKEEKKGG